MLVIRDVQMKVFGDASRREFEKRLIRLLHETTTIALDRLEAEVPDAVRSAEGLGFILQCDVARYFEWMYLHTGAAAIEGLPKEARNIVLAYGVEPAKKLDQLEQWFKTKSDGV
jgi:hypothetical protein